MAAPQGSNLPKTSLSNVGQERPAIPAHLLEPPAGMGDAVEVWGGWLWDRQGTYIIQSSGMCVSHAEEVMSHFISSENYGESIGGYSIRIRPAPPSIPSSEHHG